MNNRSYLPTDSNWHTNGENSAPSQTSAQEYFVSSASENCVICMDTICSPKRLACGHVFCADCIDDCFVRCQPKCPSCGRVFGAFRGNQPPGTFKTTKLSKPLRGYEKFGTIEIRYNIPSGIQTANHPNPGRRYQGTYRMAYLPDCPEGREVCQLLKRAFEAGLVFTVDRSVTTGEDNCVVWNNIHHKTETRGAYGYPDPTYLARVKEELAAVGIVP